MDLLIKQAHSSNYYERGMKMKTHRKLTILLIALSILMIACSSSRPYVTSMQPAGQGLIVEKCETTYNPLMNQIKTENCSQSYLPFASNNNAGSTPPVQLNNNVK